MSDSRDTVRAFIQRITAERDCLDRAIEALRPLVVDETTTTDNATNGGHAELTNGNGVVHANGHANGHNGGGQIEKPELKGPIADVVKTLNQLGEPMRATEIRRAMGRRAPSGNTDIFRLLNKAVELGVATRTGIKGSYRFSARPLQ